jgi:transglutaminase-like putative cysteine protease
MNRSFSRLWDFPSAALLLLVLLTTGQRLFATHWAGGLQTAIILSLVGVILGLALGFSIFRQRDVSLLTFGFSIPIVLLVLGWTLYRRTAWLDLLADLSFRLSHSFTLFFHKQPVHDTILFVIFMAIVFWIVGLMAGYGMTRYGNALGAVIATGIIFVIVQLYDLGRANSDRVLAVYCFLCLLLIGRVTYVLRRLFWKEQRVSLLTESKTDLNVILAVVALGTVLLVWLAPTSVQSFTNVKKAWEDLTHPFQNVQENLGHAVAGLQSEGNSRTVQFFGDTLALGNQAVTGNTVLLRVRTPTVKNTARYYWRVLSYDKYLNDQWYADNLSTTPFPPEHADVPLADAEGSTEEFAFTSLSLDLASLVTPARPVWVSYPSELDFMQVSQEKMDPIQFRPDTPVLAGKLYTVRANVFEPTIDQLRKAGNSYPDWITANYLQLPDDLPPEIAALAKRVTARAQTPYDMADAVTQYLRSNITYSKTVENPPAGRDRLEWFLFDSKSGFCNYYATAEVIMLRSVGIPARMVVGFSEGEFEEPNNYTVIQNNYIISQNNTHAWPEVYFPGIGWVEFEPTTSQPPLIYRLYPGLASGGLVATEVPGDTGQEDKTEKVPAWAQAEEIGIDLGSKASAVFFLRLILVYLIAAAIFQPYYFRTISQSFDEDRQVWWRPLPILLKNFFEKRGWTSPGWLLHWAYLAELDPVQLAFMTIYRSLHWLGRKTSPAQTPAEVASVLAGEIPYASPEIYSLLHEYQHQIYGQKHGILFLVRRDVDLIRRETLRAAMLNRWKALRGIFRPGSG